MVNKAILFLTISYLLFGCNGSTNQIQKDQVKEVVEVSENNMSNDEKNTYDKEYFENLENLEISEEGFLIIAKYSINCLKENIFKEKDPILGIKEYMPTKDFTDPYSFYHYSNITSFSNMEAVLRYKKSDNKISMVDISSGAGAGGFVFKNYNLDVLNKLNMKLVNKELLDYSNQLAVYHLTDGNFKYEIVGKNNEIEGSLPKEFYSFRIYL